MTEDENDCCPLCMEELDLTDKTFNACQCGYQVCLWCWHQIKNEYNGLCPACRTPYPEKAKQKENIDREEVVRKTKLRKQKERADRKSGNGAATSARPAPVTSANRRNLTNVRVVQKNLVYVIGLPLSYALDEQRLKSSECFGQYGKIVKVVVNKSHLNSDRANATASAYVTYVRNEDAQQAIDALDCFHLEGRMIRASFGTTKYCNFFLRNLTCSNPDCLYLHELGEEVDSYTKEEMQAGKAAFREVSDGVAARSGDQFPPPPTKAQPKLSSSKSADSISSKEALATLPYGRGTSESNNQRRAQSAAAIAKLRQSKTVPSKPVHQKEPPISINPAAETKSPYPFHDAQQQAVVENKVNGVKPNHGRISPVGSSSGEIARPTRIASPEPPFGHQQFPSLSKSVSEVSNDESLWGSSSAFGVPSTSPMGMAGAMPMGNYHEPPAAPAGWTLGSSGPVVHPSMDAVPPPQSSPHANSHGTRQMGPPSSSPSSFASIDAAFHHPAEANPSVEPTTALANMLGVQLTGNLSAQARRLDRKASSRFAFANRNSEEEIAPQNLHAVSPPPSLEGLHPPPQDNSGIAFLQQMLPNVNISYGNEGPSARIHRQSSEPNQDWSWKQQPSAQAHLNVFQDPVIVTQGSEILSAQKNPPHISPPASARMPTRNSKSSQRIGSNRGGYESRHH